MNRAVVQAGAGVVVFVLLAAASIFITNQLFKVTASDKPTVTFSVVNSSPAASQH
jgi:hypothetical protein